MPFCVAMNIIASDNKVDGKYKRPHGLHSPTFDGLPMSTDSHVMHWLWWSQSLDSSILTWCTRMCIRKLARVRLSSHEFECSDYLD